MYNPIYKNVSLSLSSSIKHKKNRGSTYFFFKMELYLCPANQINLQLMKIKTFMLLLMLSAGACTVPPHSSGNQDTQQWQQTIQQLNTIKALLISFIHNRDIFSTLIYYLVSLL